MEVNVVLYLQGREKFKKAAQDVKGNILNGQASNYDQLLLLFLFLADTFIFKSCGA